MVIGVHYLAWNDKRIVPLYVQVSALNFTLSAANDTIKNSRLMRNTLIALHKINYALEVQLFCRLP
jgi:hypothetical protein